MLAQIVTTALGFFLLVIILKKLFWRVILKMLDDRRMRIARARDCSRGRLRHDRFFRLRIN